MSCRIGLTTVAGLALFLSLSTEASAAMVTSAKASTVSEVESVTFWAHSYPYRYVPRRQCPLTRVETPYGWYWDRVCITSGDAAFRRTY